MGYRQWNYCQGLIIQRLGFMLHFGLRKMLPRAAISPQGARWETMIKMRGICCYVVIVLEYFNVPPWQWKVVGANNMKTYCIISHNASYTVDLTGCMGIFCTVGSSHTKKTTQKNEENWLIMMELVQLNTNKLCLCYSGTSGNKWNKNRLSSLVVTSVKSEGSTHMKHCTVVQSSRKGVCTDG